MKELLINLDWWVYSFAYFSIGCFCYYLMHKFDSIGNGRDDFSKLMASTYWPIALLYWFIESFFKALGYLLRTLENADKLGKTKNPTERQG